MPMRNKITIWILDCRHYKLEAAIASMTWKVSYNEIFFVSNIRSGSIASLVNSKPNNQAVPRAKTEIILGLKDECCS